MREGEMKLTTIARAATAVGECPVRIRVHGKLFQVPVRHLVAASDYFRSMFSGLWEENDQNEIELKGPIPTANAMKILIGFIETGKMGLSDAEVEETVAAADFLQIHTAIKALGEHIGLENWTAFNQIAYKYNCDLLKEVVLQYVSDNYRRLKGTTEFDLYLTDEEKRQAATLPFKTRKGIVTVCVDNCIDAGRNSVKRPRVQYLHQNKWEELTRLPETLCQPKSKLQFASQGHFIYCIGWTVYNDVSTSTSRVICDKSFLYDIKLDEWKTLQPLGVDKREEDLPHLRFAAAAGYLFVFGRGVHLRYDFPSDQWERMNPFPDFPMDQLSLQYAGYTITTHEDKLFVLFESPFDDVSVASYDPTLDTWSRPFRLPAIRNPPWCCILSDGTTINILIPEYKRITCIEKLTGEGLSLNILSYNDKLKKLAWMDVIRDDRLDRTTNEGSRYLSIDGALYRIGADYTAVYNMATGKTKFISSGLECKMLPSESHQMNAFVVQLPDSIL